MNRLLKLLLVMVMVLGVGALVAWAVEDGNLTRNQPLLEDNVQVCDFDDLLDLAEEMGIDTTDKDFLGIIDEINEIGRKNLLEDAVEMGLDIAGLTDKEILAELQNIWEDKLIADVEEDILNTNDVADFSDIDWSELSACDHEYEYFSRTYADGEQTAVVFGVECYMCDDQRVYGGYVSDDKLIDMVDFEDTLSEIIVLHDEGKYRKMIETLEALDLSNEDFNHVLFKIEYLKLAFSATTEEVNYLLDLISTHKNTEDIFNVYIFWKDTGEDLSIVEKVFLLKEDCVNAYRGGSGDYGTQLWIEDAFNEATDFKYGTLSPNDIIEYWEKGLSTDDILLANVLCRQGVFTINEILDKCVTGEPLIEIQAKIDSKAGNVKSLAMDKTDVSRYSEISSEDIILSRQLARISDQAITDFYDRILTGVDIDELSFELTLELNNTAWQNVDPALFKSIEWGEDDE